MNNNYLFKTLLILVCAAITACTSGLKKVDIPSSANPQSEISKFDALLIEAREFNIDVLAKKHYASAIKMRDEAKSDLASFQKQEEILDDVRIGRGHLEQAYTLAESRQGKDTAAGVFAARRNALRAGAATNPEINKEFRKIDSDFSNSADSLSFLSTDKLVNFEKSYAGLENKSVIAMHLGAAQAKLNGAKQNGAVKRASNTYKTADLSIKQAESAISTNVRNPQGFRAAVVKANSDANFLNEVVLSINENKNLSETAAIKMVTQKMQIKNLKTDLSNAARDSSINQAAMQDRNNQLSSEIISKSYDLQTMDQNLMASNKDLAQAQASLDAQRALDNARTQFSSDEAEAYQQGNSLVIRMKNMNFATGRSDVPKLSLVSLAKISEVAKYLNASAIKVEGHTDSTGTSLQNKAISEKRADAVASYFKLNGFEKIDVQSTGFGFQKPIATNKSKEGRAQNRRVDIVITPSVEIK
jgi:OOP family OmpA-OmpF porin